MLKKARIKMSSLFSGKSSISPWIEDTVFDALVHGPSDEPQRPRLAQVLAFRRGSSGNTSCQECCPSLLVIHDGKTSVNAFLTETKDEEFGYRLSITGSVVRISNWSISLTSYCLKHHLQHLLETKEDASSFFLESKSPICLEVESVETLGAHGMGIVGDPVPLHDSVKIRRALLSLESKRISLQQQLRLATPLGNVEQLFAQGTASPLIDSILALAAQNGEMTQCPSEATTNTAGKVVLGNVEEALLISNDPATNNDPVGALLELAKQFGPNRVAKQATIDSTYASPNEEIIRYGGVVLGDVRALLTAGVEHYGTARDPVEHVLALARQPQGVSTDEQRDDMKGQGALRSAAEQEQEECKDCRDSAQPRGGPLTTHQAEAEQAGQNEQENAKDKVPASIEPYPMDEDVMARKASIVSFSGISSVLKSVLSRKSFSSGTGTDDWDGESGPPITQVSMKTGSDDEDGTSDGGKHETAIAIDKDDDDESDSELGGISDMLISQTQDDPAMTPIIESAEAVMSKKRSLDQVSGNRSRNAVGCTQDAAPHHAQQRTSSFESLPESTYQDKIHQAREGPSEVPSEPGKKKRRRKKGLLSAWVAQHIRK